MHEPTLDYKTVENISSSFKTAKNSHFPYKRAIPSNLQGRRALKLQFSREQKKVHRVRLQAANGALIAPRASQVTPAHKNSDVLMTDKVSRECTHPSVNRRVDGSTPVIFLLLLLPHRHVHTEKKSFTRARASAKEKDSLPFFSRARLCRVASRVSIARD